VGVIMDGNGRWATSRGLPRFEGHREGAKAARRIVDAAPGLGIGTLTLYALSSDNWNRPPQEVQFLMQLLRRFLRLERDRCMARGIRVSAIGRRDRIPQKIRYLIEELESATRGGPRMHLRIAIDYSARDSILRAATRLAGNPTPSREDFALALSGGRNGAREPVRDVDLVIRTGGEKRLSDFLLWESAYAELYFSETMWPDFDVGELAAALEDFTRRDRRFGLLPQGSGTVG
jgi:undecaprenyl diphosphate synthase